MIRHERAESRRRPPAAAPGPHERQGSPAAKLIDLQRLAGNAAISDLIANRQAASPTVQREGETTKDGRRKGELWPWGPITARKSVENSLTNWIAWIRVVEMAYGPDKQAVLQRLRRLYYSKRSGKAGALFDAVIAEQAGAGSKADAPIDSLAIGTIALDGLFETDTVRTLTGESLDPGHILAALDVAQSGVTTKAEIGAALYDTPWTGVVTWTGDLASWFVEWSQQMRKAAESPPPPATGEVTEMGPPEEMSPGAAADPQLWETIGASKASKADLLGDMDAQVLAHRSVRKSTPESIKAEKRIVRDANIGLELTKPLHKILEEYYGYGTGRDTPIEAEGRFPLFVKSAVPRIPHKEVAGAKGTKGSIELTSGAEAAIRTAITDTARLIINEGTSDRSDPIGRYPDKLRDIARRFAAFLATGLKSGDAPWP